MHSLAKEVVDSALEAGEMLNEAKESLYRQHDAQVERVASYLLDKLQAYMVRFVEDPYMPAFMKRIIRRAWTIVCNEINPELLDEFTSIFARANRAYKANRMNYWPGPPRLWYFCDPGLSFSRAMCHTCWAMRAKFLYAQMPADGGSWKVMRDPLGLLIMFAKMNPWASVYAFLLTFLLMDRRDEYQLVRFILQFKAAAFVTAGVMPAVQLGLSYHSCIVELANGNPDYCVENAPSASPSFPWALLREAIRIVLVYGAFYLLASGHAVGGTEELMALEYARLDVADGSADGKLSRLSKSTMKYGTRAEYDSADVELIAGVVDAHRNKSGVQRRLGGYVPYFLAFDATCLFGATAADTRTRALHHECPLAFAPPAPRLQVP